MKEKKQYFEDEKVIGQVFDEGKISEFFGKHWKGFMSELADWINESGRDGEFTEIDLSNKMEEILRKNKGLQKAVERVMLDSRSKR